MNSISQTKNKSQTKKSNVLPLHEVDDLGLDLDVL